VLAVEARADIIWPAAIVANSFFHFWWISAAGTILEAAVLVRWLRVDWTRACLMSLVANAVSATVGVIALTFGMLGWHLLVDPLVGGTFAFVNLVASLVLMWFGSVVIESLVCRIGWKYPLRRTFPPLMLGNLLSYAVVAVDLFACGGWWRH
jgi:hypothetical protein